MKYKRLLIRTVFLAIAIIALFVASHNSTAEDLTQKAKDSARKAKGAVTNTAEKTGEALKRTANKAADAGKAGAQKAEKFANDVTDKTKSMAKDVETKTKEGAQKVQKVATNIVGEIKQKVK